MHWLSWDKMARAKCERGMGFCGISEFNISLLGKHYWRLLNGENTLLGKIFERRYCSRCSIIEESTIDYAPSYAWRSVLSARDLIRKDLDGESGMVRTS